MSDSHDPVETARAVISRVTGIPVADLVDDANIYLELGIDSLKALEMLAVIERELGVVLEETECVDLETLGEFFAYVRYRAGG